MENNNDSFDAVSLIRQVVPDLDVRMDEFRVDGIELDDDLLVIFVEQLQENVSGVKNGLATGDLEEVASQAHSVKGMCGSIGVPELSVLGYELEAQAKAGNQDGCSELLNIMEQCLQGYQAQL